MAVYIRDLRTGRFYAGFNRWAVFEENSFDFPTAATAKRWMKIVDLHGCELIEDSIIDGEQAHAARPQSEPRQSEVISGPPA
jgi:hypothetical protein